MPSAPLEGDHAGPPKGEASGPTHRQPAGGRRLTESATREQREPSEGPEDFESFYATRGCKVSHIPAPPEPALSIPSITSYAL